MSIIDIEKLIMLFHNTLLKLSNLVELSTVYFESYFSFPDCPRFVLKVVLYESQKDKDIESSEHVASGLIFSA